LPLFAPKPEIPGPTTLLLLRDIFFLHCLHCRGTMLTAWIPVPTSGGRIFGSGAVSASNVSPLSPPFMEICRFLLCAAIGQWLLAGAHPGAARLQVRSVVGATECVPVITFNCGLFRFSRLLPFCDCTVF